MKTHQLLSLLIIGILTMSCSSGGSDSPPTGNDTQLYDVAISMSPSDGGTISPSADSSYEEGTQVTLQANSTDSYTFSGWTGTVDTSANPVSITVDKNYNLTANFQIKSYELTVDTNGGGTVTEQIVQQKTDYEHGTIVKLNAEPAQGWEFVEWQGDITSTNNPDQITVDDSKSVTAVFEKKSFALTINISGNGSVTKNPDQVEYEFGTTVDLTANPDSGWEFEKWDRDTTSTNNPLTISIDSAITITAVFTNPTFAGGNGTESYPFKISTPEQLQAMIDYKDSHFVVINNIDASETIEWFSGKGFNPIGNIDQRFTGSFNGNGFTISNLYINRSTEDYIGFFGAIDEANIENITLQNINITGGQYYVGGLIGSTTRNPTTTNITNCQISGSIIGNNYVGGLIGFFTGIITNSSSEGSVTGSRWVGGLIGRSRGVELLKSFSESSVSRKSTANDVFGGLIGDNYGTLIRDSYATGNVEGRRDLGGLIGINYSGGSIINSYSTGKVTGYSSSNTSSDRVGGLVGNNQGEINNSQAFGDVNSEGIEIGGLVGINSGNIYDSKAEGNIVTLNNSAGGLVGNNKGIIETSISSGNVSSNINSGGFAGNNSGKILNSYSLGDSEGNENVGGFIGNLSVGGEIRYSYSIGSVVGTNNFGGLIGLNEDVGNIIDCYWNKSTSNQTVAVGFGNNSGVTGLTTSQMTGSSAETNMSTFDFVNIWVTTNSYPALFWE